MITDSNGNRVVEIDERGNVVWSVDVAFPYEAERLGTGDESTGGPSATAANLTGTGGGAGDAGPSHGATGGGGAGAGLVDRITGPWRNAVAYVTPVWMDRWGTLALLGLLGTILVWIGAELRWAARSVALRSPIELEREE